MKNVVLIGAMAVLWLSAAQAVAEAIPPGFKTSSPATGKWCNRRGTFVVSGGKYRYTRGGKLFSYGSYSISGNRLSLRNASGRATTLRFYRNAGGTRYYKHPRHANLIRVSRRCNY